MEHIIEFDLPHHQSPPGPQHTHAHTLQTQFTSTLVIVGHLNSLEHSTALLYIKQTPHLSILASTFRRDLEVNIDSKTGMHFSHVFWSCSAREITCLSTQEWKNKTKKTCHSYSRKWWQLTTTTTKVCKKEDESRSVQFSKLPFHSLSTQQSFWIFALMHLKRTGWIL